MSVELIVKFDDKILKEAEKCEDVCIAYIIKYPHREKIDIYYGTASHNLANALSKKWKDIDESN